MAKKDDEGTAQADATAADTDMPAGEKTVYYNQGQPVSPREHQPAVPGAADDANKSAVERATAQANSDVDATSPPGMVPEPKAETAKADDINEKVSEQNAANK